MAQTTSVNLPTQEQPSSEQVEALVAGAAHTTTDRNQPAGQTQSR